MLFGFTTVWWHFDTSPLLTCHFQCYRYFWRVTFRLLDGLDDQSDSTIPLDHWPLYSTNARRWQQDRVRPWQVVQVAPTVRCTHTKCHLVTECCERAWWSGAELCSAQWQCRDVCCCTTRVRVGQTVLARTCQNVHWSQSHVLRALGNDLKHLQLAICTNTSHIDRVGIVQQSIWHQWKWLVESRSGISLILPGSSIRTWTILFIRLAMVSFVFMDSGK